jgi:mercuric ion transport protein
MPARIETVMSSQPHTSAPMKAQATSMRKNTGLKWVGVAVASTLIASTCCVLPLVLVLAGITGAWMTTLTALKPITPIFTVIAVATLAWAGYLIFRPAKECPVSEDDACSGPQRFTKWVFFASALFIAVLLLFPIAAPLFY